MTATAKRSHHDVVAGILRRDGRVLLCHRHPARRWYPNTWDLPGGHVAGGEDAVEALRRELEEELGISILVPNRRHDFEHVDDEFRLRSWIIDDWVGDPVNRTPEEHDAIAWFTLADVSTMPMAHPGLLPQLERVLVSDPPADA